MAWFCRLLVACTSLATHGLADPEVVKFMGMAYVPTMPLARPARPAQPVGKIPTTPFGAEAHAPLAIPSKVFSMQQEIAQLEEKSFAMKAELQQMKSQIAITASVKQEKQNASPNFTGPQLAGVFGIASFVGAFLFSITAKFTRTFRSNWRSGNSAVLQLAGSGTATLRLPSRSSFPMMTASVPAPPPSEQATPEQLATESIDARSLLLLLASRRSSQTAKDEALQSFTALSMDQRQQFLDDCISIIDENRGKLFSKRRWALPLPSRRAALGTYARLLDGMQSEAPYRADGGERRRLLGALFRQLGQNRGIWALERESANRTRDETSMEEMLRRTPTDLETPSYVVVAERTAWQVRQYHEFSVASTARARPVASDGVKIGAPSMPAAGGFQALAGYILGGRNVEGEKMAMTTPVFNRADTGEMSFVMPSRYWKDEAAGGEAPPTPLDNSVTVSRKGGGVLQGGSDLAVLWFGGFANDAEVARRKAQLLEALGADGEWAAMASIEGSGGVASTPEEAVLLMQYNDPFTLPWKRRNEVAIPVCRRT